MFLKCGVSNGCSQICCSGKTLTSRESSSAEKTLDTVDVAFLTPRRGWHQLNFSLRVYHVLESDFPGSCKGRYVAEEESCPLR